MRDIYIAVILLSLLSCVTTCIGVLMAFWLRENAKAIAAGIGFSVGIMILISVFELLPEAAAEAKGQAVLMAASAGAALVWLAHFATPHVHLTPEHGSMDARLMQSVYLVVLGLILHDVPEGFAMANAYVASPALGVLVAVTIALHNLPEEFGMSVPAVTLRSRSFLFAAAILSALAEPLGAIVGLVAVDLVPTLNPYLMAFAAGAMLFVSFHELIPMARRYGHGRLFLSGAAFSGLVYMPIAAVTVG